MSEYVDFHYMPLEGRITGKQVLQQTEDAINDLGNKVYSLDVDEERIDEAIENSEQAINTANAALSAVTTDRSVWKNTVAEMKETDIDLGVTAATRGKLAFNDGSGAFYGVRSEKGGDVESDDTVFLNNGNVAERIHSMNIIAKGNNIIFVANVAELIDSDALIGNVYGTTGYYSANDGGAGLYSIRTKTQSDVEDGGSIIFLDNGNVAELIMDGKVNAAQFGAVADDTSVDNSTAISNACRVSKIVDLQNKQYTVQSLITLKTDVTIQNGWLYSPSEKVASYRIVFYSNTDGNETIDVTFKNIRFTSVMDQPAVTFQDENDLSSNLFFFASNTPVKLSFYNCDIANCEYCVKKGDYDSIPLTIVDTIFHDTLMPMYCTDNVIYINNSVLETTAKSRYYHSIYFSFHRSENANIHIANSVFDAPNQDNAVCFRSTVSVALNDMLNIYINNCQFKCRNGIGNVQASNQKMMVYCYSCSLKVCYYAKVYNSEVYFNTNDPKFALYFYNCNILIDDIGFSNNPSVTEFYNCRIKINGSYKQILTGTYVKIENCYINADATTSDTFYVKGGTIEFVKNYYVRHSANAYQIIWNHTTDPGTLYIYGNLVDVDAGASSFPTTNGNVKIS